MEEVERLHSDLTEFEDAINANVPVDLDDSIFSFNYLHRFDSLDKAKEHTKERREWVSIYKRYNHVYTEFKENKSALEIIPGIGSVRASALRDRGIECIPDIVEADVEQIKAVDGIGDERALQIKDDAIELYSQDIEEVPGVGSTRASVLRDVGIETLVDLKAAEISDLMEAEGIGETLAIQIKDGVDKVSVGGFDSSHVETLVQQYEPRSSTLEEATEAVEEFEDWLAAYKRYNRLCQQVLSVHSSLNSLDGPFADISCSIELASYHPTKFSSVTNLNSSLDSLAGQLEAYELVVDLVEKIDQVVAETSQREELREMVAGTSEYLAGLTPASDRLGDDMKRAEQIEAVKDTLDESIEIMEFLSDVNHSHPSVEVSAWYDTIEMALDEQYPEALHPIKEKIRRMDSGLWEKSHLYQYNWDEFETLVATLYEDAGYETEVTQSVLDQGVDVWAENNDERVAIQVKHFKNESTVGRETLQKLVSTLAKGDADQAVVITSSTFARTAIQYGDDFGPDLELVDEEMLLKRLSESNVPPPGEP